MGKPLVTRDGRPAIYVAVLKHSNPNFPLLVEILQNPWAVKPEDQNWKTENLTIEGEYISIVEDNNDVFLAGDEWEEHHKGPINRNENQLEIFK